MMRPRPNVGDRRWVVEWCVKAAMLEDRTGDPDNDVMMRKAFATHAAALEYAKTVSPQCQRPYVEIEEQVFSMEDDDLYPRGHWEAVSEYGEIYEGE
jgi:hypothetical protein